MSKHTLKAEKRTLTGRKVKKLRIDGVVPANIFGREVKSSSIQVNAKEFGKVYGEAGETGLVELMVGSEVKPVLIHNVQIDPVHDDVLHIDFLQVNLKQKVSAKVPLELVGESPAEKQGLGTVVQYINEIEVEALPTDLPDKFEIDMSSLAAVEQMIQVKDIKIDKSKVEIKGGEEDIVIKVEPPKEEKVEEVPAPAEAEVGAEGQAAEGGEQPKGEESGGEENPKENPQN